jgi:hypothetical protein
VFGFGSHFRRRHEVFACRIWLSRVGGIWTDGISG